MSKRGSGSSAKTKSFRATELNITGTQKQIAYARDIVQRAFDTMDLNIKHFNELAKNETNKGAKETYKSWASEWKEYKADMTKLYRQNAKTELKASNIIDRQYAFDATKDIELWKKRKKG